MSTKCHHDAETFSECNLKTAGLYRYAEHPSTALNVVCFAFDDGPVHVWLPWEDVPLKVSAGIEAGMDPGSDLFIGLTAPDILRNHDGTFCAHNSMFERTVLNGQAGRRHNYPLLPIDRTVCTMAKCAVHGLPHALEHAATALGTHPKKVEGANAMRYLAKPRKDGSRPTPHDEPDRFIECALYCIDDVKAERAIDDAVPDLTDREQQVYFLDQRINDRGVRVDIPAIHNVQTLIAEYKADLAARCKAQTGYAPTQTGKLAEYIRSNGYPQLVDLTAATVTETVKDPTCPAPIVGLLKIYSTYAMKAVTKFDAMLRSVCGSQRLHGMFQFYGAGTGRWSSRIVQLQNLFRPVIKDPEVAIESFAMRCLTWLRSLYSENPMKVFASCVRGMLVAEPGKDLMAFDFSSIEARIVAWLAGQTDILDVFRGHGKIYEHSAAKIYRVAMETVTPAQRFVGKVATLALGYQGGAAAFKKMAKQYGVDIDEMAADVIKNDWREANPKIVRLWYNIDDAAKLAVKNPGSVFGIPNKKILFKVEGRWLYMRLPSGRRLAYFDPGLDENGAVSYMGVDTYSRRWTRVTSYGGRWLQNAAEGIARDLLVNGVLKMEEACYWPVGTVHDEGISEIDESFGTLEEAERIMTTPLQWAEGLPVKAAGWRAKRYQKG